MNFQQPAEEDSSHVFAEIALQMEVVDWFGWTTTDTENIALNLSSVVLLFWQEQGRLLVAIGELQVRTFVLVLIEAGGLIAKDMGLVAEFHSK